MPTTLLFWNVQRLGGGTPADRNAILEGVVAEAFKAGAAFALLCEVTSGTALGDTEVSKQVVVARRKGAHAQLGYGSIGADLDEIELQPMEIPDFDDVFGVPVDKKGGTSFKKQSKRLVAHAGAHGGVEVYVYHANASPRAPFLVAWVAEAIRQAGAPFVLVGDLNCEPADLAARLGALAANFNIVDNGNTHSARAALNRTYDYAVASGVMPVVGRMNITAHLPPSPLTGLPQTHLASDHLPILVTF